MTGKVCSNDHYWIHHIDGFAAIFGILLAAVQSKFILSLSTFSSGTNSICPKIPHLERVMSLPSRSLLLTLLCIKIFTTLDYGPLGSVTPQRKFCHRKLMMVMSHLRGSDFAYRIRSGQTSQAPRPLSASRSARKGAPKSRVFAFSSALTTSILPSSPDLRLLANEGHVSLAYFASEDSWPDTERREIRGNVRMLPLINASACSL